MLALIDYGSGNIHSVINALRHEGADVELISDPARLDEADGVVLPGVGAFGDCVRGLQSRGLWEPLAAWLAADKPFLGICVGYQMLFESSEESPGVRGFGFFPGVVKRFNTPGLKVPQIGWNQLDLVTPRHPLWKTIKCWRNGKAGRRSLRTIAGPSERKAHGRRSSGRKIRNPKSENPKQSLKPRERVHRFTRASHFSWLKWLRATLPRPACGTELRTCFGFWPQGR